MDKNLVKRTPKGDFYEDPAGISHYFVRRTGTLIHEAIDDAINNRPNYRPAWFWFNHQFVPMQHNDTVYTLHARWQSWADTYRRKPSQLKELIEHYAHTSG